MKRLESMRTLMLAIVTPVNFCSIKFRETQDAIERIPLKKNQFVLTQEFLSLMLGVSRTGSSLAAGILSKAQLISYARSTVTILTETVRAVSCECYAELVNLFRQVMDE